MKAIRVREFGGPEVMRLEEASDPQPGPGQVIIKVYAIAISPIETYMRAGNYYIKPSLPYTPGTDAAGFVDSIGPGVAGLKVGDRVFTSGAISGVYAEKALCDASQVHPLPDKLSFSQGAAVHVSYYTAYHALFHRARVIPGDTVLIHGATGGVGLAAVQLARAAGTTVIGTGGTDQGRRLAQEQGAHHMLDHRERNDLDKILAITGGRGVDVILEMLANVNLGKDLQVLARSGRVVLVGSRGTVEINPREAMVRDGAILGMQLKNASAPEIASIRAAIAAGLENGTIRPAIGLELPLADAPRAHREIMESAHHGKIVLIP